MLPLMLLFIGLALVLMLLGTMIGSVPLVPATVFRAILGQPLPGEEYALTIVRSLRIPRVIMALLVGMMLASSGTVVQAVFRNPLADPYIIGISASAVTGAVLAYSLGLSELWYGVFGFVISVTVALLLFRLAGTGDGVSVSTLLIIGIAVSSFLGAITSFSMYAIGEDSYRIVVWTMGYLGGANWNQVRLAFVPLVIAIAIFLYRRSEMDALMCGDEEAYALGVNVRRIKKELLMVSALVVAFSIAFCGMIGFVGLIVPHALRMIIGYSNTRLVAASAVVGGVFLLAADLLARTVLSPTEVPIGVITAFAGAPFFVYLAARMRHQGVLL